MQNGNGEHELGMQRKTQNWNAKLIQENEPGMKNLHETGSWNRKAGNGSHEVGIRNVSVHADEDYEAETGNMNTEYETEALNRNAKPKRETQYRNS